MIDVGAVRAAHEKFLARQRLAVRTALHDAGREGKDQVSQRAPFKHRTGAARKGTSVSVNATPGGHRLRIRNSARHALFLEFGTSRHIIRGRPMLHFFWPKVGAWVSFRSVNHPGTKATWFLRAAAAFAHGRAGVLLKTRLGAAARAF